LLFAAAEDFEKRNPSDDRDKEQDNINDNNQRVPVLCLGNCLHLHFCAASSAIHFFVPPYSSYPFMYDPKSITGELSCFGADWWNRMYS
jgi:hypothetical protein